MKRKIPLILLCILFAGIFLYYGSGLLRDYQSYQAGKQAYTELTQYVHPQPSPVAPEQPKSIADLQPDDTLWPVVDFESLQAINPDVVGWICIEGTDINYPVVQGTDNSYYINHMFNGDSNSAGSIFMDYRNRRDLSGRNTVLYGHNMKNGTMFNQINQYKSQDFYDLHPTGLLITPEANYKIQFVAGYVTDLNSDAWKLEFASDGEFSQWLENAISQSTFTGAVTPAPGDRVITLSTCTYEYSDARYVLIGILK